MPTNIHVIRTWDFVRATPGGVLDLRASEKLLTEVFAACAPEADVLLDTRHAMTVLSVTDLWNLVLKATRFDVPPPRRAAVLCPPERFDFAQFFALCAERRGFDIMAFLDYERAMEWLIAGHHANDERAPPHRPLA